MGETSTTASLTTFRHTCPTGTRVRNFEVSAERYFTSFTTRCMDGTTKTAGTRGSQGYGPMICESPEDIVGLAALVATHHKYFNFRDPENIVVVRTRWLDRVGVLCWGSEGDAMAMTPANYDRNQINTTHAYASVRCNSGDAVRGAYGGMRTGYGLAKLGAICGTL